MTQSTQVQIFQFCCCFQQLHSKRGICVKTLPKYLFSDQSYRKLEGLKNHFYGANVT